MALHCCAPSHDSPLSAPITKALLAAASVTHHTPRHRSSTPMGDGTSLSCRAAESLGHPRSRRPSPCHHHQWEPARCWRRHMAGPAFSLGGRPCKIARAPGSAETMGAPFSAMRKAAGYSAAKPTRAAGFSKIYAPLLTFRSTLDPALKGLQ
jgi:hypothetical protein